MDFRFNTKFRDLRTSKSLQSQHLQTISGYSSPLVPRLDIPFLNELTLFHRFVLSIPTDVSSGKRVPWIAFAGCIETLSLQESASGSKIQLSERSEFCIFETAFSRFLQA